ncbi:zinc ribbon domain-containing protein [Gordonia sp. NPDC003376]
MKVDAARQRLLLDLADTDASLARLDHRARNLPEDAEIAETTTRIEAAREDLVRAEISAEDLDRDYRKMDSEITGMRDREQKDSAQLTAGGLAPKALSELQHELHGLARRRSVLEDDMLQLMEQQEAVATEQERASATVAQLQQQVDTLQARRAESLAAVTADREVDAQRRAAIAQDVPDELLAIYDRQRADSRIGAGLLRQRRCGACRMEIDRGTLTRIAALADDDVVRCEECGAILVRNHESGL